MIDDKSFGGKVGVVGSGKSIYVISLFLLNVGFARSMGTEQYGSFLQVFMFTALFMILSMGIPETMYFFLPRLTDEERPRFLGQTSWRSRYGPRSSLSRCCPSCAMKHAPAFRPGSPHPTRLQPPKCRSKCRSKWCFECRSECRFEYSKWCSRCCS